MTDKQAKAFVKQWHELKAKHPDAILLFRCGDFYEAYDVDAQACAKILGIELNNYDAGCFVTGFPYYALDTYLPKLIRAKLRVAICDQIVDTKVVNKQESINPKNEEEKIMANVNVKPAELIGKKIVIKNTNNYYVVTSVDGETVNTEFHMGDNVREVPISWTNVQSFIASGVYVIEGMEGAAKATDEVEEVQDVNPTKPEPKVEPKAEEPKAEPKPKTQKPKAEKPKAESNTEAEQPMTGDSPLTGDRYTCVPYTTSKGKTGAKIYGVTDTEPAYTMASTIHASASFERGKGGEKKHYLVFGPKYAEVAKRVCEALNAGKPIANLQAIVNTATEALAQAKADSKTYTKAEVIDLMKRAIAGDKEAIAFMEAA